MGTREWGIRCWSNFWSQSDCWSVGFVIPYEISFCLYSESWTMEYYESFWMYEY